MLRKVRDASLDTRTARSRLATRQTPYFRLIEPKLHLGYRKLASGPGTWIVRRYRDGRYLTENLRTNGGDLIVADDFSEADGNFILTFGQAQELAKAKRPALAIKSSPYLVNDAMADYFMELEGQGKPTDEAKRRFNVFIKPTLGNDEVVALTSDRIKNWHRTIAKTPARLRTKKSEKQRYRETDNSEDSIRARRASANRILTILKAGLNLAWYEKKVPTDNAWRSVQPFQDVDKARVRYLEIAEAVRCINACESDFRQIVQGALQSGARYGQLAKLKVQDFNPVVGTVQFASRKGKGSKLKIFHANLTAEGVEFFKSICFGRSKNDLIFPNTRRTQRAIQMAVAHAAKLKAAPLSPAERAELEKQVHTRDDGMWHASEQNRLMLEACQRANINPPIGFHILRHTWASHAVMNGIPLLIVAKNLGHSDTRMVEKHYGHLAPSYVADAIRAGGPKFGLKTGNTIHSDTQSDGTGN